MPHVPDGVGAVDPLAGGVGRHGRDGRVGPNGTQLEQELAVLYRRCADVHEALFRNRGVEELGLAVAVDEDRHRDEAVAVGLAIDADVGVQGVVRTLADGDVDGEGRRIIEDAGDSFFPPLLFGTLFVEVVGEGLGGGAAEVVQCEGDGWEGGAPGVGGDRVAVVADDDVLDDEVIGQGGGILRHRESLVLRIQLDVEEVFVEPVAAHDLLPHVQGDGHGGVVLVGDGVARRRVAGIAHGVVCRDGDFLDRVGDVGAVAPLREILPGVVPTVVPVQSDGVPIGRVIRIEQHLRGLRPYPVAVLRVVPHLGDGHAGLERRVGVGDGVAA